MTPAPHVHYRYLDGLRGLGILLVILGHALGFSLHIPAAAALGGTGVMVFFVLSGFLITDLLVRERTSTGRISLRRFYIRRTLRIFPAYYVMLAVMSVLAFANVVSDVDRRNVVICGLYLRNVFGSSEVLGHAWSLSLEEQFYLLWPALFLMLPKAPGRAARFTLGVIAVIVTARSAMVLLHPQDIAGGTYYVRPWYRFDSLLMGCTLALWVAHGVSAQAQQVLKKIPAGVWLTALVLWSVVQKPASLEAVNLTCEMILAGGLLLRLRLQPEGLTGRVMESAFLGWLGKLSYSIYLWQQLFLVSRQPGWEWGNTFPLNIAFTLAAALLSYNLVERPFLRLKARFA